MRPQSAANFASTVMSGFSLSKKYLYGLKSLVFPGVTRLHFALKMISRTTATEGLVPRVDRARIKLENMYVNSTYTANQVTDQGMKSLP